MSTGQPAKFQTGSKSVAQNQAFNYNQPPQTTAPQQWILPQNKVFQLNKQAILTARKLEKGPLENYTHMATLIHKINILLLEYESIHDLRNICGLIFSDRLLNTLIDFCMNTEHFANFGIRLLEILSLEFTLKIANSEIFAVIQGLLRTNDYETVAQCLSFISVIAQQVNARESEQKLSQKCRKTSTDVEEKPKKHHWELDKVIKPKLLSLVMNIVSKQPDCAQVEFLHHLLEMFNICIQNKQLRESILDYEIPSMVMLAKIEQAAANAELKKEQSEKKPKEKAPPEEEEKVAEEPGVGYISFLKLVEKQDQVKSVKKMHQKIVRQRKELEFWQTCRLQKQEELENKDKKEEEEQQQPLPAAAASE